MVRPADRAFPRMLGDLDDPVDRLWVLGRSLGELPAMVAIVGTRRPTPYGPSVAHMLARDLAGAGFCIISGMAAGVDAAAHEGALAAGGATVAVLGSGIDVPYPAENRDLYARIVASGTVVAEVPPGSEPRKEHFQPRNRIIAALAHATILVQGRAGNSGAFGTVSQAHKLNREVFAVPGDVRVAMSSGPHALLLEGWAHPCTRAADVINVLGPRLGLRVLADKERTFAIPSGLRPELVAAVEGLFLAPADARGVAGRAGLDLRTCTLALAELELEGIVRRDASGVYELQGVRRRSDDGP